MKPLISSLPLLLLLLFSPCSYAKEPIRIIEGVVTKVSDGDTIQVRDRFGTKVKVRLYGIDAPETEKRNRKTDRVSQKGQPFGEKALESLAAKVHGQPVKLEVMDMDRYRRAVSIVWQGNRNVNTALVSEGLAWAYREYLDRPYATEYLLAEEGARRGKRGLWQQPNPQPPWEYRRSLKAKRYALTALSPGGKGREE